MKDQRLCCMFLTPHVSLSVKSFYRACCPFELHFNAIFRFFFVFRSLLTTRRTSPRPTRNAFDPLRRFLVFFSSIDDL